MPPKDQRIVSVGMTGASGTQYGLRLVECLLHADYQIYLMLTKAAQIVIGSETDLALPGRVAEQTRYLTKLYKAREGQLRVFGDEEWTSPVASGSGAPHVMVICPCSMATLSAIAAGASENLLERATDIIIGGGMAYTFFKAQGGKIGKSIHEDDSMPLALEILAKAKAKGVNIHLPVDNIVADDFSNSANTQTCASGEIPDGWEGLDVGEKSREIFAKVILASKTILWNGPMGVFEMENFQAGTKAIAVAVAEATQNGAFSLVGGGDSVSAVNQFGFNDKVSYVSTGGGAMLEYFEGKTLPGIAAIRG